VPRTLPLGLWGEAVARGALGAALGAALAVPSGSRQAPESSAINEPAAQKEASTRTFGP
jgi:hypothetical protein